MSIIKRALGRTIVDPCIRKGRVPSQEPLARWFMSLAESRRIRLSRRHLLAEILGHHEWKTSFSISDHTLLWVWNYINRAQPQAILELGSGMSTLVFSKYISSCARAAAKVYFY